MENKILRYGFFARSTRRAEEPFGKCLARLKPFESAGNRDLLHVRSLGSFVPSPASRSAHLFLALSNPPFTFYSAGTIPVRFTMRAETAASAGDVSCKI